MFWAGDHPPRHVHVYRSGKLVVKWDLENSRAMKGKPTGQILKYIRELQDRGSL
ncbi:MAG: DUF4160 domain-containing protein [Candidatus Latescibacteria bacterium]|nr:DUF4160 domain-containing protein [Candidatus Latescibacterota bacterium]